jgi:hypothetical protein
MNSGKEASAELNGCKPFGGAIVRKYRVRGICLVPTECEMEIEATSQEDAVKTALSSRWQHHIDNLGGDNTSAFDWQPRAEEISSANVSHHQRPEAEGCREFGG